ncbi:MAG: RluA family pseudouridine synthase [Deltaproteobacteria bacterium]|nr:RluA family pseudouridine synthase [Deltaproteobacteria bacterium]
MEGSSRRTSRFLTRGLAILYEDRDILVVDKPAGLLTMGTEREKERTAYANLTEYVRKGAAKSRARIFIVHRLDRETSGVLVFAKTFEAKDCLQSRWDETKKRYLAVVHGRCEKRTETITTYLAENSAHGVYSTVDPKNGKWAQTVYTVLRETKDFTLLDVELLTGRKHQIRVHLADRGHPVVGDKRYGRTDKAHRRLALHARSLSFRHPVSGEVLTFEAKAPVYFEELVGSFERILTQQRPAMDPIIRR